MPKCRAWRRPTSYLRRERLAFDFALALADMSGAALLRELRLSMPLNIALALLGVAGRIAGRATHAGLILRARLVSLGNRHSASMTYVERAGFKPVSEA